VSAVSNVKTNPTSALRAAQARRCTRALRRGRTLAGAATRRYGKQNAVRGAAPNATALAANAHNDEYLDDFCVLGLKRRSGRV